MSAGKADSFRLRHSLVILLVLGASGRNGQTGPTGALSDALSGESGIPHHIGFFLDMDVDEEVGARAQVQAAVTAIRVVELINSRNASVQGCDQNLTSKLKQRNITMSISLQNTRGELATAQLALVKALREEPKVTSVVGPALSQFCAAMAPVAQAFGVPMISFWASSIDLASRQFYPMFARVWPSDAEEISSLMALVQHYNWNHIVTIGPNNGWGTDFCQVKSSSSYDLHSYTHAYTTHAYTSCIHSRMNLVHTLAHIHSPIHSLIYTHSYPPHLHQLFGSRMQTKGFENTCLYYDTLVSDQIGTLNRTVSRQSDQRDNLKRTMGNAKSTGYNIFLYNTYVDDLGAVLTAANDAGLIGGQNVWISTNLWYVFMCLCVLRQRVVLLDELALHIQ
jgi:hypothetical protein